MSATHQETSDSTDCAAASTAPVTLRIEASSTVLGEGMRIYRAMPSRQRRMIGAWCFLDHFGPLDVTLGRGLRVGPHPHIGLQTVTWPLQGEILHRDSLGSMQLIRPGQLNLMTAGRGISHSEESPLERTKTLHGAQLWIALPDSARHGEPAFSHHAALPVIQRNGLRITVLLGKAFGERSPGRIFTPLVGMELQTAGPVNSKLPIDPAFEYGALVLNGAATVEGETLAPGTLLYLGCGRESLEVSSTGPTTLLLIGGEPFREPLLMWWNFVARDKSEIIQACRDWNKAVDYMGDVQGYDGARLTAPMPPWAE